MLTHYQNQSCPELADLLQGDDAVTFSVLRTIVQGICRDIYTDHEGIILCYSCPPYPIWVWCKDMADENAAAQIAQCIKENFPFSQGFDFIMEHRLLVQLGHREEAFRRARIKLELLSYRLDHLRAIDHPCQGTMTLPRKEEIPQIIKVWHDMAMEMEGRDLPQEICQAEVAGHLASGTLFIWRSEEGEILAMTARADMPPYSKVARVYTFPQHRRKGYAINLVHQAAKNMQGEGLVPILYTDAGYPASNACYRKIGFQQVGNLCTICSETE